MFFLFGGVHCAHDLADEGRQWLELVAPGSACWELAGGGPVAVLEQQLSRPAHKSDRKTHAVESSDGLCGYEQVGDGRNDVQVHPSTAALPHQLGHAADKGREWLLCPAHVLLQGHGLLDEEVVVGHLQQGQRQRSGLWPG